MGGILMIFLTVSLTYKLIIEMNTVIYQEHSTSISPLGLKTFNETTIDAKNFSDSWNFGFGFRGSL